MKPQQGKWYQADNYLFRADKIKDNITQGIRIDDAGKKTVVDDMDVDNNLFGTALKEAGPRRKKNLLKDVLNSNLEYRNRKWNLTTSK